MTRPWKVLAKVTDDQGVLELRQRGESDFLIVVDGRVLMNSYARRSEEELARLGLAHIAHATTPRVLIAGLGMGFTLRAALDVLPAGAEVVVCEIDRHIVDWCRGPLAQATQSAIDDPRVRLRLEDVAAVIANAPAGHYDAILLDLYEGPNAASQAKNDPFYSAHALVQQRKALAKGGVLGVWSEDRDPAYAKRFVTAGFDVKAHAIGAGGRQHIVYLGRRT